MVDVTRVIANEFIFAIRLFQLYIVNNMSKTLKTSYNVKHRVESFFTGSQIVFDENGEHFFCAYGSIVNKVCVQDGQVKAQISTKNEGDTVIKFTLSSNNGLLVIAYFSGLITKFNLGDDVVEREFKSIHKAPVSQLKINSTDTLLATASSDGTVKLWNLINHYCSHNLKGVNGVINNVEFLEGTRDGEEDLLFCTGGDDCIHVFSLETSKRKAKLSKHCSTITDLKFSADGQRMISVGRDKIAVVWDIKRGNESFGSALRTIPVYESVESLVIIETKLLSQVFGQETDGDLLVFATVGEEGSIKFWDTKTGAKVLSQNQAPLSNDRNPSAPCFQLIHRPGHNQLSVVSTERDIFIYDLPYLNLTQQLQGHLDEILSICWFANDNYLAIACNSNDLKVMEVGTSRCQHLKGHTDIAVCVASLPCDPMRIISSSKDCTILVWQFDQDMNPTIIYRATGHTHAVHSLSVSPHEPVFFSGGEDTTLKRWVIHELKTDGDVIEEPKAIISTNTVKAHDARIDAIDVSPNEQLVATGSRDKTARIFSASGLQIIATLKGHRRGVNAIQFSPIDQVIVTAADMNLRMWNLQDFTCVKTFQGHDCAVLNFSFLSSGLQILSMGADGNMKMWDCKANECTKTIDAHSGSTWTLSLTKDDKFVATGGQDEKLVIWKDVTEEEREERLANLQTQVVQEQDFVNFINKKKWKKALNMAIKMENQSKTLSVLREIVLEPNGFEELEEVIAMRTLDQINFIIDCCLTWTSTAKNSSLAQQVLNILIRRYDNVQLARLPAMNSSMDQLKVLTEKSFNRCERLVQEATFVDFFMKSFRIQ